MKCIILTLAGLLLVSPSQAQEKKNSQTDKITQQLSIQQQRLKNIEEQASTQRRQIEDWYVSSLKDLRQTAERMAKRWRPEIRALWTEFMKMHKQTPLFDAYYKQWTVVFATDPQSSDLRTAQVESYFLSAFADLLLDKRFCDLLTDIADGGPYNPYSFQIRIQARRLLRCVNDLGLEKAVLQDQRAAKLAAVDQWEQDCKANVLQVMSEIKAAAARVSVGVVGAIVSSGQSQLCMVDGFDKIIREGDSVGDVKIVKIYPDAVEFAKAGQTWTQEVGKPANAAWK